MASHLTSGRVNLGVLRETYRRELLECLDKCIGSKVNIYRCCTPIFRALRVQIIKWQSYVFVNIEQKFHKILSHLKNQMR